MQAIVQSVLGKYFELFIRNFTADQFQLSLFKGEGTLHNIGDKKKKKNLFPC
jgi:hypothetical protein